MVIPDGAHATKQVHLPRWILRVGAIGLFILIGISGFLVFDYIQLRSMRASYFTIAAENQGLKGEARALMSSLEEVRRSLSRVQDYTAKLTEITNIKVNKVSKETGIGPLSAEEYKIAEENSALSTPTEHIPLGIDLDKLVFRPVFDKLYGLGQLSNSQAVELQHILSNLSQQKYLLASIPSISPVNGWVTSGFGDRISPFTGQRSTHRGIDVASPIGTPVHAPADGVVIFTGAKAGYGNFIMIAHGYGIVSRYGHNAQNMVQPGQRVKRGEQIATVGMSGRTTGPHLHYEILVNGNYANPKKFILNIDAETSIAH